MLNLNLPAFDYVIENKDNKSLIFDIIRKKFVVLTPEEWVRQHFVHFLINTYNISKNHISLETGLKYNYLGKRSDILVLDNSLNPLILVECKAPFVEINEKVVFQIGTYNAKLKARYLVTTNGLTSLYWENEKNNYVQIQKLPDFKHKTG